MRPPASGVEFTCEACGAVVKRGWTAAMNLRKVPARRGSTGPGGAWAQRAAPRFRAGGSHQWGWIWARSRVS